MLGVALHTHKAALESYSLCFIPNTQHKSGLTIIKQLVPLQNLVLTLTQNTENYSYSSNLHNDKPPHLWVNFWKHFCKERDNTTGLVAQSLHVSGVACNHDWLLASSWECDPHKNLHVTEDKVLYAESCGACCGSLSRLVELLSKIHDVTTAGFLTFPYHDWS